MPVPEPAEMRRRTKVAVLVGGLVRGGAELDIVTIEARAKCRSCGVEQRTRSLAEPCACGSFDRVLVAGDELRHKEVEVL